MFVEVLLQLLVGKVDVELFESVHFEILKTENVQNPNEGKGLFACERNSIGGERGGGGRWLWFS